MNVNSQSINEKWVNEYLNKPLYTTVDENIDYLKQIFGESFDFVTRKMTLDNNIQQIKIGLVYISGITDLTLINETILDTLVKRFDIAKEKIKSNKIIEYFEEKLILISEIDNTWYYGKLINTMLNGDMILFIDGVDKCLIFNTKKYKERAVDKPTTHVSLKGSKEAFTENIATNITLIRKRIRTPNLWTKKYIIGEKSNCNVAILYINGVCDEKILEEVEKRLKRASIDNLLDSSYLTYYLKEKQKTIFPTIYDTERPDIVCASLFEGKIAIIVDGSPFVIIAPSTMVQFVNSVEDYYHKSSVATFVRIVRLIAGIISIIFPAIYISLVVFHSELLPINLVFSIAGQRQNVPLPASIEVLVTLFAFDLLTEVGTRMPTSIGSTLSFLGAIVIGQSAVEASVISSIMIIIVAITGLGGLALADYELNLTFVIIRYFLLIVSIFFGLFGLALALLIMITHLVSLRSFGVPYLYPYAPYSKKGIQDSIFRTNIDKLFKRNKEIKK